MIVVITGCSTGGIGHALAKEFHRNGATVIATSRTLDSMQDLRYLGIVTMVLDVTVMQSVNECIDKILSEFGRVDILVNNAGCSLCGPLAEANLDSVRKVFETNFFGSIAMAQAVFPSMAARNSGKIINIGSVAGLNHRPWSFAYSSSKSAIMAATNCMRMEMKPFGIQVMLVVPGVIATNIFEKIAHSLSSLPPNSFYEPFESAIEKMATTYNGNPRATPVNVFARRVVRKCLRPWLPWRLVAGYCSSLALLSSCLPMRLRDSILWSIYGRKETPNSSF